MDPKRLSSTLLTVGELAKRSGVAVSTLHFYEEKKLIASTRTSGNQRRYPRYTLRRVAIIRAAQRVGISLKEIQETLAALPIDEKPSGAEWSRMSKHWRTRLDLKIARLTALRSQLDSCIGCGCLSLVDCPLRNPGDELGARSSGPVLMEEAIGDAGGN